MTQTSADMPHGVIEYFIERYQTAIASSVAIVGFVLVLAQLRTAAKQHERVMLFNIEPERRAMEEAEAFAAYLRKEVVQKVADGGVAAKHQRLFTTYSTERRDELLKDKLVYPMLEALNRVILAVGQYNSLYPFGPDNRDKTEEAFQKVVAALADLEVATAHRTRELLSLTQL
ncbi:hypothetical protein ACLI1C_15975 [Devosia sp. XGJD_8]|uniref:hypothetical protein n=1 Tax=Devosia sp. XGJD_8 TaxID=3391187 RepID=UPI0039851561